MTGSPVPAALRLACVAGGAAQSVAGSAGALAAASIAGDGAAGLPQALLVLGSAGAAVGLSALTARRRGDRRSALATGLLVALVGCVGTVMAVDTRSLTGLLVGSLLLGAGTTSVMLSRYAGADLVPDDRRAAAMSSVLAATTIGAVAGPNLLSPAGALARALGLPTLAGPYLVGAVLFAGAAGVVALGLPRADAAIRPLPATAARPRLGPNGVAGVLVLATANLVMVGVMTMAPVHLHHLGGGLGLVGAVVSLHIAGMFAPSPLSGWLVQRCGADVAAVLAVTTMAAVAVLAAVAAPDEAALAVALVLVGVGWNLALVAGSTLLTAGVPAADRPAREAWGEVGMGVAAAGGGAASGPVVGVAGYAALAMLAAVVAASVAPLAWSTAGRPSRARVAERERVPVDVRREMSP